MHKSDLEGAIAAFREAIRIKPDYVEAHNNLGVALRDKGDVAGGIAACKEAIRLRPADAPGHCNLGHALKAQGRFRSALTALRRGHELGSRNPRWSAPSADWVREVELLAALDERLPAVLEGKTRPKDGTEWLMFAQLCQTYHKRYAVAARFFEEAFVAEPKLAEDGKAGHRYNAACAAALAGCGQGKDAESLDAKERARLRRLALDWLRADLKVWQKSLDQAPAKAGPAVAVQMKHWLADSDFAGVRGPDAIDRLPEAERPDWRKLWQDVETSRKLALVPAKPPAAGQQPKSKQGSPPKGDK